MATDTTSRPYGTPHAPASAPPRRTNPRPSMRRGGAVGVLAVLVGIGVWALVDLRINIATLVDGYAGAVGFVQRVWPLRFPEPALVVEQVGITLAIVLLATLLSVLLSLPLSVWAAANTARGRVDRFAARAVVVVARAIPDIVLAIVFVRVFGLGSLPGVLAMGLHSVGMVGKLYADAIEQIDEGPREALRATGARRPQQLWSAVLPQALPAFIAIGLHRFDINLRVSAILGYVGVAGIGREMSDALGSLRFDLGIAWALILVLLCVLVELLSSALRKAVLQDSAAAERYSRHTIANGLRRLARRRAGRPEQGGAGGPVPHQRTVASHGGGARQSGTRAVSPPWTFRRLRRVGYSVVAVIAVVWAVAVSGIADARLEGGLPGVLRTLAHFWPPGTGGMLGTLLESLLVTLKIGFAATLIGVVLALPIGSLAARNVAPGPRTRAFFRGVVLAVRGAPELVLAIILVVIVGLGPVAGTLALGLGSVGLLGKLVADSLEEVDPGPETALRAIGASRPRIYFAATLPQATPAFIGNAMYQLDVNIRSATLLGIVGGGGIGFYLLQAARVRDYEVVTTIMLLTLGAVLLLELVAMWLRRSVLRR